MLTDDSNTVPAIDHGAQDPVYASLVNEQAPELFCDACGYYPIEPMHGHFVCPRCRMPTKCCEGLPAE